MKVICPKLKNIKSKKERAEIFSRFLKEQYPDAPCALEYENDPFKLLVMARLSAQCTDKRVNEVSKKLFLRYPTVKDMAEAKREELEEIIRPCGLFRTKADSILNMSNELISRHNSEVPSTYEELVKLSGVGMKIANLILGDIFSDSRIVPDTHCIRITSKVGLISKSEPITCVRELEKLIPKEEQSQFCHRIVLFGREFCKAPTPLCEKCPLNERILNEISDS